MADLERRQTDHDDDAAARSIPISMPSFSSFPEHLMQKKQSSVAADSQQESSARHSHPRTDSHSDTNSDNSISSFKRRKSKKDKHKPKKKKRKYRHESDSEQTFHGRRRKLFVDPKTDLFTIDRHGDIDNMIYEGLRNTVVPFYRRFGDCVLGDSGNKFRLRTRARDGFRPVLLRNGKSNQFFFDTDEVAAESRSRMTAFRTAVRVKPVRVVLDRSASKINKNGPTSSSDQSVQKHMPPADFIALEDPKEGTSIRSPSAVMYTPDVDLAAFENDLQFQERVKEANQCIQESPKDPNVWIAYADLQDRLADDVATSRRAAIRRAICDKKLSILDRALDAVPHNDRLISMYMDCRAELDDPDRLVSRWEAVLEDNPLSLALWKQYLDVRMSLFGTMSVIDAIDIFSDAISTIHADSEHDERASKDSDAVRLGFQTRQRDRESILLLIVARVCAMLMQSGYTEYAIAIYQANIEFNCYTPKAFMNQSFEQRIVLFEEFWESEHARFGEMDAVGWELSLVAIDDPLPSHKPYQDEPNSKNDTSSHLDTDQAQHTRMREWAYREINLQHREWLPLRKPTSESEIEDIYRSVLFDDVRKLVCDLRSSESHRKLIYMFLRILGMPFNPSLSSMDPLMHDAFLDDVYAHESRIESFMKSSQVQQMASSSHASMRPSLSFPLRLFPQSPWSLYSDGKDWTCMFDAADAFTVDNSGIDRRKMIGVALQQAQLVVPDNPWFLPMLLVMESSSHMSNIESMAKTLLKKDRMHLHLWNAYAQTLVHAGRLKDACKVYMASISSCSSLNDPNKKQIQSQVVLLYAMFADTMMHAGQSQAAINILVEAAENASVNSDYASADVSGTKLLRARKQLDTQLDALMASVIEADRSFDGVPDILMQHLLDIAHVKMLLEYLLHSIDSTNTQMQTIIATLIDHLSPSCRRSINTHDATYLVHDRRNHHGLIVVVERIYEIWIRLLVYHASISTSFKPSMLRDAIDQSLQMFPYNTMFLTALGWIESRMGIDNRVRRTVDTIMNIHSPSYSVPVFAVWSERHQRTVPSTHVIRSILDKSYDISSIRYSQSIWYISIIHEYRTGHKQKAKSLLYQAIDVMPWCKGLYLMAFTMMGDVFTVDELRDVYSMMEDREIRLRGEISVKEDD